jgi:DNA-binding HxlR family transcriptional regulator
MESANPLAPLLFAEIRRKLPNISEKVLADQLRQLERDGIFHRASSATAPPKSLIR